MIGAARMSLFPSGIMSAIEIGWSNGCVATTIRLDALSGTPSIHTSATRSAPIPLSTNLPSASVVTAGIKGAWARSPYRPGHPTRFRLARDSLEPADIRWIFPAIRTIANQGASPSPSEREGLHVSVALSLEAGLADQRLASS